MHGALSKDIVVLYCIDSIGRIIQVIMSDLCISQHNYRFIINMYVVITRTRMIASTLYRMEIEEIIEMRRTTKTQILKFRFEVDDVLEP